MRMQRNQHLYGMIIIIIIIILVSSIIVELPLCTLCSQSRSNESFWLGLAMGKFYNLLHTRLCILFSISIIHAAVSIWRKLHGYFNQLIFSWNKKWTWNFAIKSCLPLCYMRNVHIFIYNQAKRLSLHSTEILIIFRSCLPLFVQTTCKHTRQPSKWIFILFLGGMMATAVLQKMH